MMLVFGDLHLRDDSADLVLGHILPSLRHACVTRGIVDAACLGDVYHVRYRIDARLHNAVMDEFDQWHKMGIRLRILPGNHDQYDAAGRNVLEVLGYMPGIQVFSKPYLDDFGWWVPYHANVLQLRTWLRSIAVESRRVLWLHQGIAGSWLSRTEQDVDGLTEEDLCGWPCVIAGHYHRYQHMQLGPTQCWYVGSPWQVSAAEAGEPKGFCVWNGRNLQFEPCRWGRRIHMLRVGPDAPRVDLTGIDLAHDDVRVEVVGAGAEARVAEIGAWLAKQGAAHVTVTPEVAPAQARLGLTAGASLREYALAYVEQMASDLDQGRLMSCFDSLIAEGGAQ